MCARSLFNMWILLCFLFCSCGVFWWHVDGQWEQKEVWRNADQATMPSFFHYFGCSFRFFFIFSLPFPSCSFFWLLLASVLYVQRYICEQKQGSTNQLCQRGEKGYLHFSQHIFYFCKILLFLFLDFFNSNFSLNFQRKEQVVVLRTCQSFEG